MSLRVLSIFCPTLSWLQLNFKMHPFAWHNQIDFPPMCKTEVSTLSTPYIWNIRVYYCYIRQSLFWWIALTQAMWQVQYKHSLGRSACAEESIVITHCKIMQDITLFMTWKTEIVKPMCQSSPDLKLQLLASKDSIMFWPFIFFLFTAHTVPRLYLFIFSYFFVLFSLYKSKEGKISFYQLHFSFFFPSLQFLQL